LGLGRLLGRICELGSDIDPFLHEHAVSYSYMHVVPAPRGLIESKSRELNQFRARLCIEKPGLLTSSHNDWKSMSSLFSCLWVDVIAYWFRSLRQLIDKPHAAGDIRAAIVCVKLGAVQCVWRVCCKCCCVARIRIER